MTRPAKVVFVGVALIFAAVLASTAAPPPRANGQQIFRYDTFDDEQLWTNVLRMHEALRSVAPATALAVGLKVDAEALPPELIAAIQAGDVELTDPLRRSHCCGSMPLWASWERSTSWSTDQRRHHLRAVPLHRRQFVRAGHRQAARRLAESRPERRRDSSGSRRCWTMPKPADGVRDKYDPRHQVFDGTNFIPLTRHHGASPDPARLRPQGRRIRDLHR